MPHTAHTNQNQPPPLHTSPIAQNTPWARARQQSPPPFPTPPPTPSLLLLLPRPFETRAPPNSPRGIQPPKAMPRTGFNWQAYEAWRAHPLLKFQKRNAVPGFFIGLTAFAAYVAYDKATNTGKDAHHQ